MRRIIVLRGVPGSGKSTFVKENGLEDYTVSLDELRRIYGAPVLRGNGEWDLDSKNDKRVIKAFKDIVRGRMEQGAFTVIDSTNVDVNKLQMFKQLKEEYGYRLDVVDFTDVSIEECMRRNRERDELDRVPEYVIRRMAKKAEDKVPSWANEMKREEFRESVTYKPLDFSKWEKIHHIGDIHGCYTVMKEAIPHLEENELYIFTGDYVDRGIENGEVVDYLIKVMNKPNVVIMEGNHDTYLGQWAKGEEVRNKGFREVTAPELDRKGIKRKDVRRLYRKMRQAVYYTYGDKTVMVTHGGLSKPVEDLVYVNTGQLIDGSGEFTDDVDKVFTEKVADSGEEVYQIHGHRNVHGKKMIEGYSFNLEDEVERGGYLRVVTLRKEGFEGKEYKNDVYDPSYVRTVLSNNTPIGDVVKVLRDNDLIRERKDNQGGVSSFNFTERAFYKKVWTSQVVKARGIHIDKENEKIVARGYDKFFNIGEMDYTSIGEVEDVMEYPVNVYKKENGYLGMIGYHEEEDELYFSSKASTENRFAGMLKEMVEQKGIDREELKRYMRDENVTLVCEVVEPEEDPHIIEYKKPELILLDIVYKEVEFRKKNYEEVKSVGKRFGFDVKEKMMELKDKDEFLEWYEKVTSEDKFYPKGEGNVEGMVLEDQNNFHVKVKLPFYSHWKYMRKIIDDSRKGYAYRHLIEGDKVSEDFMDWVEANDPKGDIISVRKAYFNDVGVLNNKGRLGVFNELKG